MHESLHEPFEKTYRGYNREFVQRVRERRRQAILPVVVPVVVHEFKAKKRPSSDWKRQIRRELAARATAIHAATHGMKAAPADADRTAAEIIAAVASEFAVTASDIRGACKAVFLVAVRHRATVRVYLAKRDASLQEIGRWFGRDHTSILTALRKAGVYQAPGRGNRRSGCERG